jgi:hypothetical protein
MEERAPRFGRCAATVKAVMEVATGDLTDQFGVRNVIVADAPGEVPGVHADLGCDEFEAFLRREVSVQRDDPLAELCGRGFSAFQFGVVPCGDWIVTQWVALKA